MTAVPSSNYSTTFNYSLVQTATKISLVGWLTGWLTRYMYEYLDQLVKKKKTKSCFAGKKNPKDSETLSL